MASHEAAMHAVPVPIWPPGAYVHAPPFPTDQAVPSDATTAATAGPMADLVSAAAAVAALKYGPTPAPPESPHVEEVHSEA